MNKEENEGCGIIGGTLKKSEEKPEKDTTGRKISGIYKIINKANGKYYIGSSLDILERWYRHKLHLNRENHHNEYLQKSWKKYGANNFEFSIINEFLCNNKEILLQLEQIYLNEAEKEKQNCYNLVFVAGGGDYGPLVREKISKSLKGKYSGRNSYFYGKHHTEETKEKIRQYHLLYSPIRGKHLSDEVKQKIREHSTKPNLGKHLSNETKDKLRNLHLGLHHTE